MKQVRFCRHCGELLEHQWIHCPWCGQEAYRRGPDWEAVVDESLGKVESDRQKGRMNLLEDLSGRLDILESELDAFLAGRH